MTREEAIHKLEYSKKAYQTLIDEKVDSGKLVGDGVRGEWKAETSLDEAYKSMIEALDVAINALEQQPCEDWKFYYNHGYAQAKRDLARPTGKWIVYDVVKFGDFVGTEKYECSKCHHRVGVFKSNFCPNCGARMAESEDKE